MLNLIDAANAGRLLFFMPTPERNEYGSRRMTVAQDGMQSNSCDEKDISDS
jgi:hypothetical protein